MIQLAVLHSEQISRKAEIKYFQIPLPGTIKKIIAVEASGFLFSPVEINQQSQVQGAPQTPSSGGAASNNCPNPGIASIVLAGEDQANNIKTQDFRIGAAVNSGFVYSCGVYSVVISVTAIDGDTPSSIAMKLATQVNNTSLATWNQYGSNTLNYKPTAIANHDLITLTVDTQHLFFVSAQGECSGPPPPPPVLIYDPLFTINNNEKIGVLSIQSADATDIFYQWEAFREDKNIGFGDYTLAGEMMGEWLKGGKRNAVEILITTGSPILEAYYKDKWGEYYDKDLTYQLNILIWYEKQ